MEDKFVNFQQYDDDVTYKLAEAAADLLGIIMIFLFDALKMLLNIRGREQS